MKKTNNSLKSAKVITCIILVIAIIGFAGSMYQLFKNGTAINWAPLTAVFIGVTSSFSLIEKKEKENNEKYNNEK